MKKNFLVDQAIALSCEQGYYDLHNCFDFSGFEFNVSKKIFRLNFHRAPESKGDAKELSIEILGVDSLELSDFFVLHAGSYLLEMGYKSATDRDHDWLISEEKCSPQDHLFFRFDQDEFIRVHGKQAEVCLYS